MTAAIFVGYFGVLLAGLAWVVRRQYRRAHASWAAASFSLSRRVKVGMAAFVLIFAATATAVGLISGSLLVALAAAAGVTWLAGMVFALEWARRIRVSDR